MGGILRSEIGEASLGRQIRVQSDLGAERIRKLRCDAIRTSSRMIAECPIEISMSSSSTAPIGGRSGYCGIWRGISEVQEQQQKSTWTVS